MKHKLSQKLILINILFIILLCCQVISESPKETPIKSFVNDYANLISNSDEKKIESMLKELYESKEAEIAIITINSLDGMPAEMYAIELAHENLGDSQKDNGLLYLIAKEDRKWRIEVGYGLEATIPDLLAYSIGDQVAKSYFKQNKYSQGISVATNEFYKLLRNPEYNKQVQEKMNSQTGVKVNIGDIIWVFFFIMIFFGGLFGKRRRMDNDYFAAAMLGSVLFGRGRGGLGGGGGFGGFGGGGFGGGGAGGGW